MSHRSILIAVLFIAFTIFAQIFASPPGQT